MRMLSSIFPKKKEEPFLPETIETPVENPDNPGTDVSAKIKTTKTKKTKKFLFLNCFLDGASFVFLWLVPGIIQIVLIVSILVFKPSYPGLLLGFICGGYYEYQRMAPGLQQNWRLSTELREVESLVSVMNNIRVCRKQEVWLYRMKQGVIGCSYSLNGVPTTPTSTTSIPTAPAKPTAKPAYDDYYESNESKEYPNSDSKENIEEYTD